MYENYLIVNGVYIKSHQKSQPESGWTRVFFDDFLIIFDHSWSIFVWISDKKYYFDARHSKLSKWNFAGGLHRCHSTRIIYWYVKNGINHNFTMVFKRKKPKTTIKKNNWFLRVKWLLFDQFNVKCLISYRCCVFINIRRRLRFFKWKCTHLNHTTVPTLSIVDTKLNQKWSKDHRRRHISNHFQVCVINQNLTEQH